MQETMPLIPNALQMTDADFLQIAKYIESTVGIKMPATKKVMMQSRLASRVKSCHCSSYKEYIQYVFSHNDELILMIDALTTNKTDFFREANHFDFLTKEVIPPLVDERVPTINLWSAGCSSGEEPYTLAIVLEEYKKANPMAHFNFKITASDISTKVLDKAYYGVYPMEEINNIPLAMKKEYFLKCTSAKTPLVKVKQNIRSHVSFKRLNFMDDDFFMDCIYDVIFCRNVLIYFDKQTQENVIRKFMKYLAPGGYLFLGHSETIFSMNLPLKSCAPTVYRKDS